MGWTGPLQHFPVWIPGVNQSRFVSQGNWVRVCVPVHGVCTQGVTVLMHTYARITSLYRDPSSSLIGEKGLAP